MEKFLAVISGIYIIIWGFVFLSYFSNSYANIRSYGLLVSVFRLLICAISVILAILLFVTGVGIVAGKNWSRYVLFIMSALAIFIGIIGLLKIIPLPIPVQCSDSIARNFKVTKLTLFTLGSVFFIALPAFFLTFFSRSSVKKMFG